MFEVTIDNPRNDSLSFPPLQRRIRGSIDLLRCTDTQARQLRTAWPDPVPGQHLILDGNRGTIAEPLHDAKHTRTRERIEAAGKKLPPAREEFELDEDQIATWAFWLQRAVAAGIARVVRGELPTYSGKPKKRFLGQDQEDKSATLAKKQLAASLAVMTPARAKEYDRILTELDE